MKKCFVIGSARSGTTSLTRLIASGNKYASEEILNCVKSEEFANCKDKEEFFMKKIENLLKKHKFIKEIFVYPSPETFPMYMKRSREFLYNRTLVVRARRRNKLRQALSAHVAMQTGCWHKSEKDYLPLLSELKPIPLQSIEKSIAGLKEMDRLLDLELNGKEPVEVEYEKFFFDREYLIETLKNIADQSEMPISVRNKEIKTIGKGRLNSPETYRMIPNIKDIEELGNEENGFLY